MRVIIVGDTGIKDAVIAAPFTDGTTPVLFVKKDSIPVTVQQELIRLAPTEILVFGGTARVSNTVVAGLEAYAPTARIAGASVFATAIAASRILYPVEVPASEPPVAVGPPAETIGPINYSGSTLLVIENKIIDGNRGPVAVRGSNAGVLLRNCWVMNAEDGLKNQVSTEDCVIKDLYRPSGGHIDCMQIEGTANVTHTRTIFRAFDQSGGYGNSCFQIKSDFAPGSSQSAIFKDCHFDGGNYHGMVDEGSKGGYARVELRNCTYTDNTRYPELNFQGPYAVKDVTLV